MAIQDDASLAMIPAAYGAAKLYSVIPSNGNGDFTHSRTGNATRINKGGFIETMGSNVPRLDYPLIDGVVQSCPALLLEPSRQNKLLRSNEFNTTWVLGSTLSLTSGQTSTLTGNNDAWLLTSDGTSGFGQLNQSVSHSGLHTFSVFAKKGTNDIISFRSLSALDVRAEFNLNLGTLASSSNTTSTDIKNYGNGWYRLFVTFNASNNNVYIYPNPIGTADAGNIYIQNAQLEAGSYATSYIPTTTSAVTRNFDDCVGAGTSAEFNDSEGVLFAEIQGLNDTDTSNRYISLTDGTATNALMIQYRNVGELRLYNGGTSTAQMIYRDAGADLTENIKLAIKYGTSTSDYKVYINGVSQSIEGAFVATSMSGLDELKFEYAVSGNNFYGKVKQLMVFKTALSDSELETLSS
jgi:hypothetical protein